MEEIVQRTMDLIESHMFPGLEDRLEFPSLRNLFRRKKGAFNSFPIHCSLHTARETVGVWNAYEIAGIFEKHVVIRCQGMEYPVAFGK